MNDDPNKAPNPEPKPLGEAATTRDIATSGDAAKTPTKASPPPPPPPASTGFPFGLLSFLILSILIAVFAVQNTQDVELQFLGWRGEFPLIMIVVGVFATAVVLDEILGAILRRRKRLRLAEKQELEYYRKKK